MSAEAPLERCRNCGLEVPAEDLDPFGWCRECRRVVVRRSTAIAHVASVLVAGGVGYLVGSMIASSYRLFAVWLILVAAVYFIIFKLVRRVAFEVIRSRGVARPER